jgi:cytochrome c-type biogenesis protein CcmF
MSRSVLFILGIAVFCALGLVILLGTSAPLLTRLAGTPSQVQLSFYGATTAPAGFLLLLFSGLVAFVSWKGASLREVLRSSRRSLIVGAAAVAVALGFGARDAGSLVLLLAAGFCADMNLQAVMRKARSGKLGGAGGYLAHVGVGIMMAGVVVSGNYAKTQRVNLKVDEPTRVGNATLTFLRVVPGTAERKTAMEVRVETARGKTWYAYPKMYENSKTGQLMANPDIRNGPFADLYMAPQQYDPGRPEIVGRDVRLAKGTTTNIDGTGFTFRDFNADRAAMMRGEKKVLVLTDLTITPADGTQHDATVKHVFHLDGGASEAEELEVPAVSPNDGAVVLRLTGISKNPADEFQAATVESLSVEVTRKPLIALVWAGFYVMMAGGILAFVKRSGEARRAVIAAERDAEPRREPAVAATGPAVPAHTRSRLE